MFYGGCNSYFIISHTLYLFLKLFTVMTSIWLQDTLIILTYTGKEQFHACLKLKKMIGNFGIFESSSKSFFSMVLSFIHLVRLFLAFKIILKLASAFRMLNNNIIIRIYAFLYHMKGIWMHKFFELNLKFIFSS